MIRTSTSSMTSVPKPLKFLRPHYEELGKLRDGWDTSFTEQRVRRSHVENDQESNMLTIVTA